MVLSDLVPTGFQEVLFITESVCVTCGLGFNLLIVLMNARGIPELAHFERDSQADYRVFLCRNEVR